jgi:opacity protein-like surface antigen
MNKVNALLAAVALAATGSAASAANVCPANHVCASDPASVVRALQEAGYKAQLGTDNGGDPKIDSAAGGYDFTVYFYNCTDNKDCGSLRFATLFENDGTNTPELANAWNKAKRFAQMSAQDNGSLLLAYDVTTVGGLNQANFADAIDWWQVMLSEVRNFFSKQ